MKRDTERNSELVLETRHLLGVFFVVVVLCGVFFSLGYIVGRNTFSGVVHATQAVMSSADPGKKPSPMPPPAYATPEPENPSASNASGDQPASTDLNFFQSVEQKAPETKLEPQANASTAPPSASQTTAAPEKPAAAEIPEGYLIQVSALTRREDADSLVTLLKQKNLPVLVTAAPNDTLFHVVVGPYKDIKDAEHTKAVLELDGFRPIIKK